jgi:hypothetical protein
MFTFFNPPAERLILAGGGPEVMAAAFVGVVIEILSLRTTPFRTAINFP